MKKYIESKVQKVNGYMVTTEEYDKYGIFFQFPVKEANHDADNWDYKDPITFSAHDFSCRCKKSRLYRILQILLGNKQQMKNIDSWLEDYDFAGCRLNTLVSPIIFRRRYRELTAVSLDESSPIKKIHSIGYEAQLNDCNGACEKETTRIVSKNSKPKKITHKEFFHYTYKHLVEKELLV